VVIIGFLNPRLKMKGKDKRNKKKDLRYKKNNLLKYTTPDIHL